MDPTRRRTLRALGATAAGVTLAGCSFGAGDDSAETSTDTVTPSDTPSATDTDTGTPTDTETPTPESGTAVVYDVSVFPELVARNTPDSYATYGERDTQWIVAEVAAEADGPPPDSFVVETPTGSYETTTDVGGTRGLLEEFGFPYGRSDAGWLAARLPKPLDAERVALRWDGGRHELDDRTVTQLRRPPASFDVSYRVSTVDSIEQAAISTVTVQNTADVAGTFVAGIHFAGPLHLIGPRIALDVPPGGTEISRHLHALDSVAEPDYDSMALRLRWRGGDVLREVEFSDETPTPTDSGDGT